MSEAFIRCAALDHVGAPGFNCGGRMFDIVYLYGTLYELALLRYWVFRYAGWRQ